MPKISKYNGGYAIISLNDEDIYEKIERNLYKPILLTDIVINGIEKNDVFTTAYVEGTNIVFKDIYDKDITISDDNSVKIDDNGKHLYRHDIVLMHHNKNSFLRNIGDDIGYIYNISFIITIFNNNSNEYANYDEIQNALTNGQYTYLDPSIAYFNMAYGLSLTQLKEDIQGDSIVSDFSCLITNDIYPKYVIQLFSESNKLYRYSNNLNNADKKIIRQSVVKIF